MEAREIGICIYITIAKIACKNTNGYQSTCVMLQITKCIIHVRHCTKSVHVRIHLISQTGIASPERWSRNDMCMSVCVRVLVNASESAKTFCTNKFDKMNCTFSWCQYEHHMHLVWVCVIVRYNKDSWLCYFVVEWLFQVPHPIEIIARNSFWFAI